MIKKQIKNIIFVCKYNAFRSKVAEIYFNQINKNKEIKAVSRGFISGGTADKMQKKVAERLGVKIKGKFNSVDLKEMIKTDLIIVVANDIPKIMFNYWLKPLQRKAFAWKIQDEQKKNEKNIEKIVKDIKKKVETLVKKLGAEQK
ncbi:hypothetical protein KAR52_02970 [Candidatus Pacearchaeota archaeon]|nr:hypothetical protein [Candidatus Pacearchaeota archaeon]